jgi:hypothetical protein
VSRLFSMSIYHRLDSDALNNSFPADVAIDRPIYVIKCCVDLLGVVPSTTLKFKLNGAHVQPNT